jgi:hypothetical protein
MPGSTSSLSLGGCLVSDSISLNANQISILLENQKKTRRKNCFKNRLWKKAPDCLWPIAKDYGMRKEGNL